jgi:hypothetical protein
MHEKYRLGCSCCIFWKPLYEQRPGQI